MTLTNIIIIIAGITIIFLVACILYLVWVYRKLLEKYYDLTLRQDRSLVKKHLDETALKFVDAKVDNAIAKAINEAQDLISKSAKDVTQSMKRNTVAKLVQNKMAEEEAVAASFDEAKDDIEKFKAQKLEEMNLKANEALDEVVKEALGQALDKEIQSKLVMKAIENAKRSNIF